MPSRKHQSITKLLTESPQLLALLVRETLGLEIPSDVEFLPAPETVREVQYPEYTADGTIVVRNTHGDREAFIVEVQLRPDPDKRKAWPVYVAGVRARLGCPATLIVFTDNAATARWCAERIDLGRERMVLDPLVIGPAQIPRRLDPDVARDHPDLGVLAVITHGRARGAEHLGQTALVATRNLATTDVVRATLYADLIMAFLSEAARKALENNMGVRTDVYISDFAKRYVSQGREEGREEGVAQGREEGVAQGREEGVAQGREEGVAQGLAKALVVVLDSRSVALSEDDHAKITACTDSDQLNAWLLRAVQAKSIDDVFGD